MARGAVDFDFRSARSYWMKGPAKEIKPYERNAATMLIEDCMLAANETVAEDAYWQQLPFLYRSHEKPDGEKIRRFAIFVNNFGYSLRLSNGGAPSQGDAEASSKGGRDAGGSAASRLALRSYEKSRLYHPVRRSFRPGGQLLYAFYVSEPPISGSADPSDHKRKSSRRLGEKRRAHYEKRLDEAGGLDLQPGAAGGRGGTGDGKGEEGSIYGAPISATSTRA